MRAVIQRTLQPAKVVVNDTVTGWIEKGFVVYLGIEDSDDMEDIQWLARKLVNLRIFNDQNDKMNLSLQDVNGSVLLISQFTLFASTKKGNRPSFLRSAKPEKANEIYQMFQEELLREYEIQVATGVFGAHMHVEYTNDGPVTIIIDTKEKQ
jgi:D-tyrosyl-tRNA(Tyr) deacylase